MGDFEKRLVKYSGGAALADPIGASAIGGMFYPFSSEAKERRPLVLGAAATAAAYIYGGPGAGAAVGSALLGAEAQRRSAKAREVELKLAQRQETTAVRDREVQRKRRLVAVLGAQSAQAAAIGLSMTGSVANISLTDARRAGEDSMIDDHNTRLRIDALKRNRSSISRVSRMRTATTILGAGERIAARG